MTGDKGLALAGLPAVALTLVFVGVALVVGTYVQNQIGQTALPTAVVKCEAITWATNASYAKAAYPYIHSIQAVYNGSGCGGVAPNIELTSGNYTHNGRSIYLNAVGGAAYDAFTSTGGVFYVNYTTWNTTIRSDKLILENATSGLTGLASWLPILAIVVAAAAVIGILLTSFRF